MLKRNRQSIEKETLSFCHKQQASSTHGLPAVVKTELQVKKSKKWFVFFGQLYKKHTADQESQQSRLTQTVPV